MVLLITSLTHRFFGVLASFIWFGTTRVRDQKPNRTIVKTSEIGTRQILVWFWRFKAVLHGKGSWLHIFVCFDFCQMEKIGQLAERYRVRFWSGCRRFKFPTGQIVVNCWQRLVTAATFLWKECFTRAQWRGYGSRKIVARFGVLQRV